MKIKKKKKTKKKRQKEKEQIKKKKNYPVARFHSPLAKRYYRKNKVENSPSPFSSLRS